MKILYAIQGTGNGHLSRAMEIIPALMKRGEVDLLLSGIQVDLSLPYLIKYRLNGLSFIFGKRGGVDFFRTYAKLNSRKVVREIRALPVESYDLIINDFEPISAWAAYRKDLPCIALSNQCVTLSPSVPKPKSRDMIGELVLKYYAPSTAQYGFHFARFDENIYTPIIRKEVRELQVTNKGHYTVYLPAYDDDRMIKHLSRFKGLQWEVFSKHNKKVKEEGNVKVYPINGRAFLESMASSMGVLCAAGFATAAEALFLKKKLLVIPMKSQYEQHCNAAALRSLGVPVMKSLKKKHYDRLENWLLYGKVVEVDYPDLTEEIVDRIITEQVVNKHQLPPHL